MILQADDVRCVKNAGFEHRKIGTKQQGWLQLLAAEADDQWLCGHICMQRNVAGRRG